MKIIRTFLCTTTALGIAMAGSVSAIAAEEQNASGDAPQPAAATSAGDIVVTAQRRSERLRDVPISVTALNAETLAKAGVSNTLELAKVTPAVVLPLGGAFILPSIRGISSSGNALGDNPNVAMYVDGVYQASQSSGLGDLPDVQSVQVLKGPQGSLYGQNAAGGAIIIDTIAPSFDTHGKLSIGYGNFDDKTANGYVTGGLTDTVAAMVSGSYRRRDGVNLNLLTGGHDKGLRAYSARGKVLWEPSNDISLTLGGYYTIHNDTGVYSNAPLNGNSLGVAIANLSCDYGGLACQNIPIATKPHTFAMSPSPDTRIKGYGTSLRGKFTLGDVGTISTVTAYNETRVVDFSDVDATPVNTVDFHIGIKEHDFVQEVNFLSEKFSGLTFAAGGFFMHKFEAYTPILNRQYSQNEYGIFDTAYPNVTPVSVFGTFNTAVKDSYAGYAEVTYELTPEVTVTAAGRYSYETQRVTGVQVPSDYQLGDPATPVLPDPRGSFSFSKFTPRAVIRYKPDNNNMVYASYSKGFKSGYVNPGNVNKCTPSPECIDDPVKPEEVDAYEIGYKGKITRDIDLNISAFHYLYKNIQVYIYNTDVSYFQNAAAGRINGIEFDAAVRPTADISLKFGGSYLDAKYKSFPSATVYVPTGFGNDFISKDVSGNQLMRTPKWTLMGSLNYSRKVEAGEFGLYVGANYNSGIYYDPDNRIRQPAYALVDAEISFAPSALPGARFTIWGKNLTNHDYLQSVLESQLSDAGSYADPRTYGVRLQYQF